MATATVAWHLRVLATPPSHAALRETGSFASPSSDGFALVQNSSPGGAGTQQTSVASCDEAFTRRANPPYRLTRSWSAIAGMRLADATESCARGRAQLTEQRACAQNVSALRQCLRFDAVHRPTRCARARRAAFSAEIRSFSAVLVMQRSLRQAVCSSWDRSIRERPNEIAGTARNDVPRLRSAALTACAIEEAK
jgi:hypothetical protein